MNWIKNWKSANNIIKRLKMKLKEIFRRGCGRAITDVIDQLTPMIRGWTHYFKFSE